MLIEILAQKGLTHGGQTLAKGAVVPADEVLLMLAQPGHLHAGEQAARVYDPEQSAAEAEVEKAEAARRSLPPLSVIEKALDHYGYVMLSKEQIGPYNAELAAMQERLVDAKREMDQLAASNADMHQLLLNHVAPSVELQQMQAMLAEANERIAALVLENQSLTDALVSKKAVDNSEMLAAISATPETEAAGEVASPGDLAEAADPPMVRKRK